MRLHSVACAEAVDRDSRWLETETPAPRVASGVPNIQYGIIWRTRSYYAWRRPSPLSFRTWIVKPVQERNVQIYTNKQDFWKPSYKSFLVDPFLKTLYMYVYLYISSPDNLKLRILLNLRIIVAEKYLNPLPKWCEKENDFKSHINVWV